MYNYYPWDIQVLVAWLELEVSRGKSPDELADSLHIPSNILNDWLRVQSPSKWTPITLKQIQAIAQYRGWGFNQTVEWLGINASHLEELIETSNG